MKREQPGIIKVKTSHSHTSSVYTGEKLENVSAYLPEAKLVVITDRNVHKFYREYFPGAEPVVLPPGEKTKSPRTMKRLYAELISRGVDRSTFILGIGGGVVCDITGFAASTYMRGCKFGFVSTSLLSQVDASTGGKNGINFSGAKNIVGVFSQPEFVICDVALLKTLPEREFRGGLGELLKHGLLAGGGLFRFIEENYKALLSRDENALRHAVRESVKFKAGVVERDERETGLRRILNLGHTIGHAVESTTGLTHGEAVVSGIEQTVRWCVAQSLMKEDEFSRILKLIENLGLRRSVRINRKKALRKIEHDKKRDGEIINYVFLEGIGKPVVKKIKITDAAAILREKI